MMCGGIVLGVLGGLLAAKLIRRRLHGGGCGGGGHWGRRGWGWRGRHHGHGSGPGAWFVSRRLGLDPVQEAEVEAIFIELRDSFGELRQGGRAWIDETLEAVAQDDFDRSKVEAAAARQGQSIDGLRARLVDAAQRLHGILTPEQRRRLLDLRGSFRPPGTGPYRT